jgi:hypothetical protein
MAPRKKSGADVLGMAAAAAAEVKAEAPARANLMASDGPRAVPVDLGDKATTAIHIPKQTWDLLRRVAYKRALATGGRPSVSALVAELVERHRAELEAEAQP